MSVDQRLHRAAHEIRELPIDVPEFDPPRRDARRVMPAVLTSLLLLVGGAAVTVDVAGRASGPESAQISTESAAGITSEASAVDASARPLTAYEEVALIAGLGPATPTPLGPIGAASEPADLPPRVN